MNSRFVSMLVAVVGIVGIGLVVFQKGWLTPYTYSPPPPRVTDIVSPQQKKSLVTITKPQASSTVPNTFVVEGEAPGYWSFEGSFPVQVRTVSFDIIATTTAVLEGDWMTSQAVPFKAQVNIASSSYHGQAILILMKDNPSGMPENDDSVSMPITIQ